MKFYGIIIFTILISGCGGGGSGGSTTTGNSNGNTTGTISLIGSDTSTVGTQLDTGFVGTSLAGGGQPDYIVIVDSSSTVTFTAPNSLIPSLVDPNNGFILVVTDASSTSGFKGISMSIIVSGTKLDYACTTPVTTFIECGLNSISLNIPSKTVTFNNLTVTNVNTSTILTMNGTLTW